MQKKFYAASLVFVSILLIWTIILMIMLPGDGPEFMVDVPVYVRFGGGFSLILVEAVIINYLVDKI